MEVYVVCGGCLDDYHIIAIYGSVKKAEKRVKEENEKCDGLHAYIEVHKIEK